MGLRSVDIPNRSHLASVPLRSCTQKVQGLQGINVWLGTGAKLYSCPPRQLEIPNRPAKGLESGCRQAEHLPKAAIPAFVSEADIIRQVYASTPLRVWTVYVLLMMPCQTAD